MRLIGAALVLCVGVARADGSVGVVVSGDANLQAGVSAELASSLQKRGQTLAPAALDAEATNRLIDCFVLDDPACAQRVVNEHARSEAIVFAYIDVAGHGAQRDVTVTASWISKNGEPRTHKRECKACTDQALKVATGEVLSTLFATTATTTAATAPAAASVSTSAGTPSPAERHGLAVGVELGEPSSATVGWFAGKLSLTAGLGTGTRAGLGIQFHADVMFEATRLAADVPLRVGLGGRVYHHGYDPASADELPDTHIGLRVPVAIALERKNLQLYAEAAPGIDVSRSQSCSFLGGANSICPHAQATPLFFQLVAGVRWFLSSP